MIKLDGHGPLYQQLTKSLRRAIIEGHYQSGEKLPASRVLAKTLAISRNVVISCYEQLAAEGYLFTRAGAGSFVALGKAAPDSRARSEVLVAPKLSNTAKKALSHWQKNDAGKQTEHKLTVDFRYGPVEITQAVTEDIGRITRRSRAVLHSDYQPPAGLEKLRHAIARYVRLNRGCACHPDQIIITNGSQQALDLVARLLLNPGDQVLIEDPCYRGARQVLSMTGAQLVSCPVDENGINPDTFPERDKRSPFRMLYTTPSHQFPTGAVLPLSRRLALLEWARENRAFIIEDDYDSEFRYASRPIESIQGLDKNEQTIYIGTFSKMLSSSLRIGYIIVPDSLREPMLSLKWCSDRCSPLLTQTVMAEFLDSPLFTRHLRRMRKMYAERREALIACLEQILGDQITIQGTDAGIHLLAWLNNIPQSEEQALLVRAQHKGLGIYSVSPLYAQFPDTTGILLGYGNTSLKQIKTGINMLSEIIISQ